MSKLAIIIPSRNEPYLTRTVDGIFAAARGDVAVYAVIDGGQWPDGWAATVERHSPRLHTIRFGESHGMRAAINAGVDAARDAEFTLKCDSHVLFCDNFDNLLTEACGDREIIVPRRFRLNRETWSVIEDGRPPVDYECLTPPDREDGGLRGKVWNGRAKERANLLKDETPLFQGSAWCMKRSYFEFLDLMDEENFGTFWKEALELSLKAYLSGGRVCTLKTAHYSHPHVKRTYNLDSAEQVKAHEHSKKWLTDESGWAKQTLPFQSFLDRFGGMPGWLPGWQESLPLTSGVV